MLPMVPMSCGRGNGTGQLRRRVRGGSCSSRPGRRWFSRLSGTEQVVAQSEHCDLYFHGARPAKQRRPDSMNKNCSCDRCQGPVQPGEYCPGCGLYEKEELLPGFERGCCCRCGGKLETGRLPLCSKCEDNFESCPDCGEPVFPEDSDPYQEGFLNRDSFLFPLRCPGCYEEAKRQGSEWATTLMRNKCRGSRRSRESGVLRGLTRGPFGRNLENLRCLDWRTGVKSNFWVDR